MNKQAFYDYSGIRGAARLLSRTGNTFKNLLKASLQVFHKNRNSRKITINFDPVTGEDRLSDISAGLESICRIAEPRFIELGGELQTVFFDATGLNDQISGKAKQFGEVSDDSFLAQVRRHAETSLDELRDFRTDVSKKMEHISEVIDCLGHLHKKCETFEQTAMFIRVVGLNIGVESMRSAESSEMFSVVSEEINKVSEKITGITKNIIEDTKTEQASQASTSEDILEGMNYLEGLGEDGERAVRQAVQHIERLIGIFHKTLEHAGAHTGEISRQVGEIVQGIQFHDNMSQRIEHINHAFEDVKKLCRRTDEEKVPGGSKAKRFGRAFSILEIQEAQIEKVISEVDLVHQKSTEAFEKIMGRVADLAKTLPSFDSDEGDGGANRENSTPDPVPALMSALTQLQKIQDKGHQLVERIKVSTSQASKTADSLSSYAQRVRSISLDTHIMTLNAIVKAAHLGENGRTHEVLAQEMRNLSKRSDLFVEDVESLISQISSSAKNLIDGCNEGEKDHLDRSHTEGSPSLGVKKIASAYARFLEDSADITHRAEALEGVVARASSDLNFLPALSEELGIHLKAVTEARQIFSPWANADTGGELDPTMGLTKRYTMAEERLIHERALGIEDDAIELFGEDMPENDPILVQEAPPGSAESSPETSSGEDDLGDNVELF